MVCHIFFGRIISTKGTQLLHLATERMPFVLFGAVTTMVIAQTTVVIAGAVATTIVKSQFIHIHR